MSAAASDNEDTRQFAAEEDQPTAVQASKSPQASFSPVTPTGTALQIQVQNGEDAGEQGAFSAGSAFGHGNNTPASTPADSVNENSSTGYITPVSGKNALAERAAAFVNGSALPGFSGGGKNLARFGGGKGFMARRHGKIRKPPMEGITKGDIRRLARRGGVKRISGVCYDDVRGALKEFLTKVVKDAVVYTEYANRKTVTAMDVVYALKRNGQTLYGFGG